MVAPILLVWSYCMSDQPVSTFRARLEPWLDGYAPIMSLAHLILEASFNFLPVTYVLLIPKLGMTYGQIGTIVLATAISGTIAQPLFGWLSDRGDPRRIVILSLIWSGCLMGIVGLMPSYPTLAVLLVLAALGSAAFHPPAAALSAQTEASNRGRAMSLFSVGGNLGSAISPALVGVALGWFGLASTLVLIPMTLVTVFLLQRQLRNVTLTTRRSQTGTTAVGSLPAAAWVALLAMTVVIGARSYYQQALMTYLPEWLQSSGHSLALAGTALAAFMVAVSLGSLIGGPLSDRFGRGRIIIGSMLLMSAGHWLMMQLSGLPQMALATFIGLMIGASFAVTIVLAQEAMPQNIGLASAIAMGLGWLPAGLGAWVVGRSADQNGLDYALAGLLLVPFVGIVAMGLYKAIPRSALTPKPKLDEAVEA